MRPLVALTSLVLAAALAGGCGDENGASRTEARTDRVERVVDGDTVHLAKLGRARLIGIDTPEVYGGVECYGREASRAAKRLLPRGARVRYRFDVERRDRYDRALVYLFRGGEHVNARLVREGYATPLTIPPNVAHAEDFVRLAREARRAERGLWSPATCGGAG